MSHKRIKSVNFLPEIHRTDKNSRFLSSTIDQLIQKPEIERINGFIGTKVTPTYDPENDVYLKEFSELRENYNLEPAVVTYNTSNQITGAIGLDDLTNQINYFGAKTDNLNRLYGPEYYSYDPFIDWDKFVNYQEYFWLTTGPQVIEITGTPKNSTSTYTVDTIDNAFVFTPDGLTSTPILTLYRGNTYAFQINAQRNFYIKMAPSTGNLDLYPVNVLNNGTSTGIVSLIIDINTPSVLYYGSDDQTYLGKIVVKEAKEDSTIDVEKDVIGKSKYTSGNGFTLSNGMKIKFGGTVFPEEYRDNEYFVEGVGDYIRLINYNLLTSQSVFATQYDDNFDANEFDEYPFDNYRNLPITPEYITINRASRDLNPWTRYNRWFHKDIIKISAEANGVEPEYPANKRAQRPIIEFRPNLQLYNFGTVAIRNVDLIDLTTTDPFKFVEGANGYYVEEVALETGNTIIFNNAKDDQIRGKIYKVKFVNIKNNPKIVLEELESPAAGSSVGILSGSRTKGRSYYYDGTKWIRGQSHTRLNEAPLFDVFDSSGNSFSDPTIYLSNFTGTRIFNYRVGQGTPDTVLGFPLRFKNVLGVGTYLFRNSFMRDSFSLTDSTYATTSTTVSVGTTFVKINDERKTILSNVWKPAEKYQIPIYQNEYITSNTSLVEVTAIDKPGKEQFNVDVFLDNKKVSNDQFITTSTTTSSSLKSYIQFNNPVQGNLLLKIYSDKPVNDTGYYETPLNLTNNPLNGPISDLTLSEISDHVSSMTDRDPEFVGVFPGDGNLRDLPFVSRYGTRLISNAHPFHFAQIFLGDINHSLDRAVRSAAVNYDEFKNNFYKTITHYAGQTNPIRAVDTIMKNLVSDCTITNPYYNSDMIPFGDYTRRVWKVSNTRNKIYPIAQEFDPNQLSNRAVLVYINGVQQCNGIDYKFLIPESSVEFLINLNLNDNIEIREFKDTRGSFVAPTPSKLGLYPKFMPQKYLDFTYLDKPRYVIVGHDGSKMIAHNDYRDDIILEFEKRIFNNIKANYNPELLNIHSVIPGAFRKTGYSIEETNQILQSDFIRWAGLFGLDYQTNSTFDESLPFSYNYVDTKSTLTGERLSGFWRGIYKYFYDTDYPNEKPWEMLGFSNKPDWWELEYGPAPYTSGNEILWADLEQGYVRGGDSPGINVLYARPGLSTIIPVDESGALIDPTVLLVQNTTASNRLQNWKFGDHSPIETVWRNSSFYPFAIQRLMYLTRPTEYSSLMFDTSRVIKNKANQWVYKDTNKFINLKDAVLPYENDSLTAGYSVYIVEQGLRKNKIYLEDLRHYIDNFDINLFHKVGGFVSKDKLRVIIDAIAPTSTDPGSLLPPENYNLILNVSNTVGAVSASGVVVQKLGDQFVVKGYDKLNPFFKIHQPLRNSNTQAITIGGISESFVEWEFKDTSETNSLTSIDTTTARSSSSGNFYQQGQIVRYKGKFYRTKVSHTAEANFNSTLFSSLSSLPIKGGATVQIAKSFSKEETVVPYGTGFKSIQEVYDLIVGYGKWLSEQGFIFDEFNADLNENLDWNFSAKEFLYWTTHNWSDNSLITLSPFASRIKFKKPYTVVASLTSPLYEYSILNADGSILPGRNLSVNRDDGTCIIEPVNTPNGIYMINIRPVQKEHGMIFDNTTIFNDTIYEPETGYRQKRMKLIGFRTANWDGDYSSPGFVYDKAEIYNWSVFTDYRYGDVVQFNNRYYSAAQNISGTSKFDIGQGWVLLDKAPTSDLIPNFDYKINQFLDFYSSDIDNFDTNQQRMAQHLVGYTPRVYMDNIVVDPVSQYKFYQGFIKDKGTKTALDRISKAAVGNNRPSLSFSEEWAFRVGSYGSFTSFRELEFPLQESAFVENPQIINFVNTQPTNKPNDLVYYVDSSKFFLKPNNFDLSQAFRYEYSTFKNNNFVLPVAGYVRFDDITSTAYNENSLLDIANNGEIKEGDIIWLGFKTNGDWDVLRYENTDINIIGVFVSAPAESITFTTNYFHNFKVGDIISVVDFNDQVNGIYKISSIPQLNQFTVPSELTTIVNEPLLSPGLIFKFNSKRFAKFDDIPEDNVLLTLPYGTKFWIDENQNGKWEVYQKTENYSYSTINSTLRPGSQKLGWSISKRNNNTTLMIGSPGYEYLGEDGRVFVYYKDGNVSNFKFSYSLNSDNKRYISTVSNVSDLGYSVEYDPTIFNDTGYGLFFAGAPAAGRIISNSPVGINRVSTATGTTSSFVQEGLVKISSFDPKIKREKTEIVLLSPNPSSYERFGSSIVYNTSTKTMLVGAPGAASTSTGSVYVYSIDTSGTTTVTSVSTVTGVTTGLNVTFVEQLVLPTEFYNIDSTGVLFGHSISTIDNGYIGIGAPGYRSNRGLVAIFTSSNLTTPYQIIEPPSTVEGDLDFGSTVMLSPNGLELFVSAPLEKNVDVSYGAIYIYSLNTATGYFNTASITILRNPVKASRLNFGSSLDYNALDDALVISSLGTARPVFGFDKEKTTFDQKSTQFFSSIKNVGSVYIYNRKVNRFVLADELKIDQYIPGTNYGHSVHVTDNEIFIGAPAFDNTGTSAVYTFNKIDSTVDSWDLYRRQDNNIQLDNLRKVFLFDNFNDKVLEYLDILDPIKGKIAGVADQEIKYKSPFDPAVYSIGLAGNVVDTESSWLDEHVGDLWWDLSTVKYVWYEQGDLSYRKNNWGQLFPGATIDVYEWVGSELLPSEWSAQADTTAGLANNISGQPKYPDNSVISVKQIFNPITNSFGNYYYYWVKNKVLIPNVPNRRISSYQVASVIADPTSYGYKYISILNNNALMVSNIQNYLISNRINLNISYDYLNNSIPKHVEWLLINEGSDTSMPTFRLTKKLFDSLLGHDDLGNLVPDPTLNDRNRYGLGIRPQQTLFKNRLSALRNLIEFTNNTLLKYQIVGKKNFVRLDSQESPPDRFSGEWDQTVEDNEALLLINTVSLKQATLSCTVFEGKLRSVQILDPGYGYKIPPRVKIISSLLNVTEAIVDVEIDSEGRISRATIVNPGNGYSEAPNLEVRPYSVIVLSDTLYNGKWTKFVWNIEKQDWERLQTQKYNTPLYWNYVNWVSPNFDPFKDIPYIIDEYYQIYDLNVSPGEYVKVENPGDGRAVILERTAVGVRGNYDRRYNLVVKESGTIQISNGIWDIKNNNLGFDKNNSYDQTLYDQTLDLELKNILDALRFDIFIDDLKLYWNLFFFKAVKYALTEQPLLDWAFKTSFINVTLNAGRLDQKPVYKLENSNYYEDYLNEVKPYRSQVRTFTVNNTILDRSRSFTTDFDLPANYNPSTGQIERVGMKDPLLNSYPWKAWADNNTFEVGSIVVGNGGNNYIIPPVVSIETAPGDTGSGASAVAYISSGKVSQVLVTNPGKGYKIAPIIKLIGGGYQDLETAVAYPLMKNDKVRTNKIRMKFDRIWKENQIGENSVTDSFNCDGVTNTFRLSWAAKLDRQKISVTINGAYILGSDYTVKNFVEDFNGYSKLYSEIQFLNFIPGLSKVLKVTYDKNPEILHAAERVLQYYSPTSGMPGKDLAQVMQGIEYPRTQLETLKLDYTSKYDYQFTFNNNTFKSAFGDFAYADEVDYYTLLNVTNTGTVGQSTLTLSSVNGVAVGQNISISSTLNNKFSSSTVLVTSINPLTKVITFNSTITEEILPGADIELWSQTSNFSILDTRFDGGYPGFTLTNTGSMVQFALGISPEDIVLDGDGFYTPDTSYSTEEFVPGESADSIGINVYTKSGVGAPLVWSGKQQVDTSAPRTVITLPFPPPNIDSLVVTYNNKILESSTNAAYINVTDSDYYYFDFPTNELRIARRSVPGVLGYSVVTVGGEGVVDHGSVTVYSGSEGQVDSLAYYTDIKKAYVTVNGEIIGTTSTSFVDAYYDLTYSSPEDKRASVHVHKLNPNIKNTIQAWFFDSDTALYNEIREQTYVYFDGASTTGTTIVRQPDIIEPFAPQVIFEISTNGGLNYKRLLPPFVSYYTVINTAIRTLSINNTRNFLSYFKAENTGTGFISNNVSVYVNGVELARGMDFTVDGDAVNGMANPTITLNNDLFETENPIVSEGDVIAILAKPDYGWEYDVIGNEFFFNPNAEIIPGIVGYVTDCVLRLVTYTNHDQMLMRTERFVGNTFRRFRLSRQILNNNFVWVTLNDSPLVNKYDYIVLEDGQTIQISDHIYVTPDDEVIITSFNSQVVNDDILGYRVFNDIFGRTSFKRLSKENTTVLTQPLLYTDTEIHVKDASVLTPPSVYKRQPGVVTIAGERVEFYKVERNTLKQLRRATMGTGASFYVDVNTKVIDQGVNQTIPYTEQILVQTTITTTSTQYRIIPTDHIFTASSGVMFDNAGISLSIGIPSTTIDPALALAAADEVIQIYAAGTSSYDILYDLNGDGVVDLTDVLAYQKIAFGDPLDFTPVETSNYSSLFTRTYPVSAVDQVAIYYGGRLLNKSSTFYHDITKSYDSPNFNVIGSVANAIDLPAVSYTLGSAYIVTATNQVWIYENSIESDAINGFVYRGINYLPPEFSINTSTQVITLNIKDGIKSDIKLSVMKKQFARSSSWNDIVDDETTLSILNSTTVPARFLQAKPAELPDSYYYGGPNALTDGGQPLIDINDNPLLGI